MPGLLPDIDPDGLLEFSVVYTDRSLNHMSESFQTVMKDISSTLKKVYNAKSVVVVPGSGTFGMESVSRQFAAGKKCLVIRNGWFSFRWSQIFEKGSIPSEDIVIKARPASDEMLVTILKSYFSSITENINSNNENGMRVTGRCTIRGCKVVKRQKCGSV